MCGIAGTYRWPDGKAVTDRLTETLAHRGPDGSGTYAHSLGDGEVHLGHRRLAILDLSGTGAQPMVSDGLALTYNGELYNAPELRAELEGAGVRFRGTSDTEVLLEAWRRWGTDCLPRLRGMFAFGIFDERTGELVLARDQLGIKPLFLLRRGGGLVFASELKALAAVTGGSLEVDPAALVASLLYYWVPDSRCAFRGRRSCRRGPGCGAARTARCGGAGSGTCGRSPPRGRSGRGPGTCRTWRPWWRSRRGAICSPTCRWRRSCPAVWTPAI